MLNIPRTRLASNTLLWLMLISISLASQPLEKSNTKKSALQKTHTNDTHIPITINNMFSYYSNNGDGSLNPFSNDGGFEIQSANGGLTIFEEGFVWGGRHLKDSLFKVNGSTYYHGLQAGPILTAGTTLSDPVAANPSNSKYRIYRVRPDINPSVIFSSVKDELSFELMVVAKYETITEQQVYDQYISDWNNWPAIDGAPYTDVDNNGSYDPAKDIPGVPGADQTIWYVANDLDSVRTFDMAGSKPIGIEFQRTIWAYRRTGALGNAIFQKNKIINKSGYAIDSMYVAQWADPDIGGGFGYTDDVAGCDTILGLGYAYNGDNSDGFFGSKPPAIGFDFLQGPLVSGSITDSGKTNGKYITGKKNLGMTAFHYFIGGNALYTDPRHAGSEATTDWYNLFRGLIGRSGARYINPITGLPTPFVLSGDPVNNSGWIENGSISPPGDRRLLMCSGPFTMASGDTQEIVVGEVAAQGVDRLSSVRKLKFFDKTLQMTYDNNFEIPMSAVPPAVRKTELNKKIILDWGDPTAVGNTENTVSVGYEFQGYNVYQLPNTTFKNAKRIATFDKKDAVTKIYDDVYDEELGDFVYTPIQFGNNTGVQRYMIIEKDYLIPDTSIFKPLSYYQKYYFAVTAYIYNPNPNAVPRSYESTPLIIECIPQPEKPGVTYSHTIGDSLTVTHTGMSDGVVDVQVLNPAVLNGHQYSVAFDSEGGSITWKLTDVTMDSILYSKQTQLTIGSTATPFTFNGLQIRVITAPRELRDFRHVANPSGAIANPTYVGWSTFNSLGFPDPSGQGGPVADWGGGTWGINQGGGTNGNYATFLSRVIRGDNLSRIVPYDFELRFTATGGKAYLGFTTLSVINVPFELWNIGINTPNDPSDDFRMIPWINDQDGNDQFNLLKTDHPLSGSDNDPYTDWIYWMEPNPKTPGTAGYDAFVAAGAAYDGTQGTGKEVMARMVLVNVNGGSISVANWPGNVNSTMPATGNVIRIISSKPNDVNDIFTFTADAPVFNIEQAKADIARVNVFPNPYFGNNAGETSSLLQHVTFTHLPRKATISILNLAGIRVRKLLKDDDSQVLEWDLLNESGSLVAGGMYVAYIDLGVYGTKILKLAIIPERLPPTK